MSHELRRRRIVGRVVRRDVHRRWRGPLSAATVSVVLVLAVAALPWLRGEEPARTILRARFFARGDDEAAVDALRRDLDLPDNAFEGAWRWLAAAVRGDLGTSWRSGNEVVDVVVPAVQVSATLAVTALALATVLTALLLVGPVLKASTRESQSGSTFRATAAAVAAVPEAVIATVLVLALSVRLRWLPPIGWGDPADLVLPTLALALPATGLLVRLSTVVLDDAVREPWVGTWRANHVPARHVALALARRVVAVGGPQAAVVLVTILGSAVAVEQVFAIPGAGSLAVDAALVQDLPVLQACLAGFLVLGVAASAVAAVVHRLLLGGSAYRGTTPVLLPLGGGARWTWVPVGVLLALVIGGLTRDGSRSDLSQRLVAPSSRHPLGADAVGHDVWGRLADGTVTTLSIALAVTAAATLVGLLVALPAHGNGPGVTDVLVAVPSTVVGIVVAGLTGPGLTGAAVAVLLVAWLPLAVHARTLVSSARHAGYVEAAALAGSGRARTLVVHVLPAVVPGVVRHAVTRFPNVALGIAGLSFIGLGAEPDAAELGVMLADGLRYLERAPWIALGPAAVLVLLALAASTPIRLPRRFVPSRARADSSRS